MIVSLLFKLFRGCVFVVLLNDYLQRTFPEKYSNCLIVTSLKAIHIFSKYQIITTKLCIQIKDVLKSNTYIKKIFDKINSKDIRNEICQVKKNSIHLKYFSKDISSIHFEEDGNCFYIFSDCTGAVDKCVNKVLLYSQPFSSTGYEVSNIKFILLELKINDKTYKIDLKNDESNYYIVNNIFDMNFFIYYLKNYQVCPLTDEDVTRIEKFDIKLIDQDANIRELEITNKKFILIKKDEYIY